MFASVAVMGKTPAASYDTDAQAYFTAVEGAGGAINSAGKTAYNDLIVGLKADSLWTLIDRLWCWCAQDAVAAQRDLKGANTVTATGSPTFTAKTSYDFSGSGQYFDSGFMPSIHGVAFTQDSAHLMAFVLEDISSTARDLGVLDGVVVTRLQSRQSTNASFAVNAANDTTAANASGIGCFLASRTASNLTTLYKNGSSIGTSAQVSNGVNNFSLFIGATDLEGSPTGLSTRAQAMVSFGGGMNATQAGNYYTRLNTFKTAMTAS